MSAEKRVAVILVVALVAACVLSMSVSASAGSGSVGAGFDLWDLLDGLGGFFRDLINYIGQFLSKVIKAIGDGISYILSGIKYLFIPSKESFANFRDDILVRFDKKFGSVFSALNYLSDRFNGLGAKKDLRNVFKVTFPKSSFLSGLSIDFLAVASPVLAFIRFAVTGLCCLCTALMCYHKVIKMVNT